MSRKSDEIKGAGFDTHDRQIFETGHDQIVVWLYEKLKLEAVRDWFINGELADRKFHVYEDVGERSLKRRVVETVYVDNLDIKIEHPFVVQQYRGHAVKGFVDLAAFASIFAKDNKGEVHAVGRVEIYVEVKTSVNIGETLRQMAFYKTLVEPIHEGGSTLRIWAVCAPPFGHAGILKEQGIRFIPYKPDPETEV